MNDYLSPYLKLYGIISDDWANKIQRYMPANIKNLKEEIFDQLINWFKDIVDASIDIALKKGLEEGVGHLHTALLNRFPGMKTIHPPWHENPGKTWWIGIVVECFESQLVVVNNVTK